MACRIAIEMPHRHHRKGSPYCIRIDPTVPGEEIVVRREPSLRKRAQEFGETDIKKHLETKTPHDDLRLAINDAFKAVSRRTRLLFRIAQSRRGTLLHKPPGMPLYAEHCPRDSSWPSHP